MFRTTSSASRSRWSVGIWALLLSITAATLAAVLGIHTLGDNAFSGGVQAASSVTQAVSADDSTSSSPLAALSVGDEAVTGLAGDGGTLACTILALLCVVTLAAALVRMRGRAALALDPLAGPEPAATPVSMWRRTGAVSLTVLGISRI